MAVIAWVVLVKLLNYPFFFSFQLQLKTAKISPQKVVFQDPVAPKIYEPVSSLADVCRKAYEFLARPGESWWSRFNLTWMIWDMKMNIIYIYICVCGIMWHECWCQLHLFRKSITCRNVQRLAVRLRFNEKNPAKAWNLLVEHQGMKEKVVSTFNNFDALCLKTEDQIEMNLPFKGLSNAFFC